MIKYIFIFLCITVNFKKMYSQDVSAFINSKKSINVIDDRFISVVIDPVILWNRLNTRSQTLTLAKHLSPAFVRIQGFSTSQLSFSNDLLPPTDNMHIAHDVNKGTDAAKFTVTPSMWTSLNGWLINANLTPVFALSDHDRVNDAWNPKSVALPLMALMDKMNTTCFWEIASDTPHKTLKQYAEDVTVLRHILDAFPGSRNSWGVAGGELSPCALPSGTSAAEGAEIARNLLKRIESNVDAVNWTPNSDSAMNFPAKITKASPSISKHNPSVWTTAPRTPKPTSFEDALIWAKYLGQVAANGYNVMFRQPKVKEFSDITPAYWVSIFHKMLMGNDVLDVRTIHLNNRKDCHVFAHCAKNKNEFQYKEAVTILVVNLEETELNITTKFIGANLKSSEVHSYILTSKDDRNSEIYLNGDLLTISDLQDRNIKFMPKLRRLKPSRSICFNLPGKAMGFYVIPISCLSHLPSQQDLRLAHSQIFAEQDVTSSLESEIGTNPTSMKNLREITQDEEDFNEKYNKYSQFLQRDGNRLALEQEQESKGEMNKSNNSTVGDKAHESAILLGDDVTELITERAKEKVEIPASKQSLTRPLTSPNQVSNLKMDRDKTKLNTDKFHIRKKRELIQVEMEAKARKIRKISEGKPMSANLAVDLLNAPLAENGCSCAERGLACNCGIKVNNNEIQKIRGDQQRCIKDPSENNEILDSDNLTQPTLSNMENNIQNPTGDLQDIKKLLQQYQVEIKNMMSTIIPVTDDLENTNNIFKELVANSSKRSDEKNKSEIKNTSNEKAIPKYRLKRKLSTEITKVTSKQLTQNTNIGNKNCKRIKRQPNKVIEPKFENRHSALTSLFLKQQLMHQKQIENQITYRKKLATIESKIREFKDADKTPTDNNNKTWESSLDSVENASDDNRTTKFDGNDTNNMQKRNAVDSGEDRTKEADTYLNEISKEGKDLPNYLKVIEDDIYLVKPSLNYETTDEVNDEKMSESKNTLSTEPLTEPMDTTSVPDVTSTSQLTDTTSVPDVTLTSQSTETTSVSDVTSSTSQIMETTSVAESLQNDEDGGNSEEEFVDAVDVEVPNCNEDSEKKGLVDNVFHTMFHVLEDFHRKIHEYLHYLSR